MTENIEMKDLTEPKKIETEKADEADEAGRNQRKAECSTNPIDHIKLLSNHLYDSEKFFFVLMGVVALCYFIYIILSTTSTIKETGIWPNIPYRRPCPNGTTDNVENEN